MDPARIFLCCRIVVVHRTKKPWCRIMSELWKWGPWDRLRPCGSVDRNCRAQGIARSRVVRKVFLIVDVSAQCACEGRLRGNSYIGLVASQTRLVHMHLNNSRIVRSRILREPTFRIGDGLLEADPHDSALPKYRKF